MVRFNLNKATLGTAVGLVLAAAIAGAIAQSGPGNYVGGYPGSKYAGQKDMLADMLFNGDTSVTGGAAVSGAKFVGDHSPTVITPNFTGIVTLGGFPFTTNTGDFNYLYSPDGNVAAQLGNVTQPINYYRNTSHIFLDRSNKSQVSISSSGLFIFGTSTGFGLFSPPAALGTPSWALPTNSGTMVVSATSPGVINAATGNWTCPTCVTSSGGGAISGTAPIAVSAAGVVSINAPYGALTASLGGIVYSGSTNLAILAGTATARQMLQSGASGPPAWSTATWPATTTAKQILYSSAANVVGEITTANSSILVTDSGGTPSLSTTLPTHAVSGLLDLSGASAGQVKFPATQNPSANVNTLDDYAEKSTTIDLKFGGANTGITYSGTPVVGSTKIGNRVLFSGTMILTSKGSATGAATITGFPYTCTNNYGIISIRPNTLTLTGGAIALGYIAPSSSTITLEYQSGGSSVGIDNTMFNNGSSLLFSGVCETAS